jgi:hypothetical protein
MTRRERRAYSLELKVRIERARRDLLLARLQLAIISADLLDFQVQQSLNKQRSMELIRN